MGGANFRHLYDQQGLGQLSLFVKHWRQDKEVGKLLKCAVAWAQHATGMESPIFDNPTVHLPHLESKWLNSLRLYLAYTNSTMSIIPTGVAPVEREHDGHIMTWILYSTKFSDKEVCQLNYCRLYLNATTLSDLTNTTGNRLDPGKAGGNPSLFSSVSTWMPAHQDKPSVAVWKLWNKTNNIWSSADGRLHQPLGAWTRDLASRRIQNFAYHHKNVLFIRSQDQHYIQCNRVRSTQFRESTNRTPFQALPHMAQPAEVPMVGPNVWKVLNITRVLNQVSSQQNIATFEDYLGTLDVWEYDLLRHTTLYADPFTISFEQQTPFSAGSDGSSKYGTEGAFGWMASNASGERTASGMGPSRGLRMDSYRAECSGMLSILRFWLRLGEYTQRVEPWVGTIVTDSRSMLEKLFGVDNLKNENPLNAQQMQPLDELTPEWDLLTDIQDSLLQSPGITLRFVRSHQDDETEYERLPLFAQLNVDADGKAREFQQNHGRAYPFALLSPRAGVHVHSSEGTVTAKLVKEMRSLATAPNLHKHIMEKNAWSEQVMRHINWKAHGSALRAEIENRVHLTKLVHDRLPTFHLLNKFSRNPQQHRKCAGCRQADKTRDHILRCSHTERAHWRSRIVDAMTLFHRSEETAPVLENLLTSALGQWFAEDNNETILLVTQFPEEVQTLIAQQNSIGWRQVFNGRFSSEWERLQDEQYSSQVPSAHPPRTRKQKRPRTGQRWQKKLILEIWKQWSVVWKMRNEMVHGKDQSAHQEVLRIATSAELRAIYDNRAHLDRQAESLLFQDVQEHEQRPQHINRNWIAINAPVFKESLRRAKRNAVAGVRSIRSYFATVR